jgi:DNA repair ATPase RecN
MKLFSYIIIPLLISTSAAKAQQPITLVADSVKLGSRYFSGFSLGIPETKAGVIKAQWIKTIEKGTKSKVYVENDEMTLFGAMLPDFYKGSINIISQIFDQDSLTSLFVSVQITRDTYVGITSVEYDKLSKYLRNFAKQQYIEIAKEQVSVESKKLSSLEKELKSLRKSTEKSEKGIQSSNNEIITQNDNIKKMNKELEILDIKIDNASTLLSTMSDEEAKKTKSAELKDLQKNKKSLLKNLNSAQNSISKANTAIQDYTKDIELHNATQKEMSDKINQQKIVLTSYQNKLKTIEAY